MGFRKIICFFILAGSISLSAQNRETSYSAEMFGSASSGKNTPFWMVNHTWGMVPLEANNFYLRGAISHKQQLNNSWSYSLGLDLAGSYPYTYKSVWLQQLYGELNWKSLRLNLGAKEDYRSLLDENLSMGDLNISRNARPAPEVKMSIPSFLMIPYTGEMLYFKGDFAVGKYLDGGYQEQTAQPFGQEYVKNTLSHHKSLYFRIGSIERDHPLQFAFGLEHHAQWGGDVYRAGTVFHMAHSFDDFIRVVTAQGGGEGSLFSDALYKAGNHTGTYEFRLDYKLRNSNVLSAYLSHFFEDESGLEWDNAKDMLLGFQFKSQNKTIVSGALFEYMYMRDQSGPIHFNITMDESHQYLNKYGWGMDNYYNNADYVQGRSYFGRALGNPLFLSPEYNGDGRMYFKSNRIMALHGGLEGFFSQAMEYRLMLTYGESNGRYDIPFSSVRKGTASVLDLTYHFPKAEGLDLKLSLGYNNGEFFGDDTFGAAVTFRKRGLIKL